MHGSGGGGAGVRVKRGRAAPPSDVPPLHPTTTTAASGALFPPRSAGSPLRHGAAGTRASSPTSRTASIRRPAPHAPFLRVTSVEEDLQAEMAEEKQHALDTADDNPMTLAINLLAEIRRGGGGGGVDRSAGSHAHRRGSGGGMLVTRQPPSHPNLSRDTKREETRKLREYQLELLQRRRGRNQKKWELVEEMYQEALFRRSRAHAKIAADPPADRFIGGPSSLPHVPSHWIPSQAQKMKQYWSDRDQAPSPHSSDGRSGSAPPLSSSWKDDEKGTAAASTLPTRCPHLLSAIAAPPEGVRGEDGRGEGFPRLLRGPFRGTPSHPDGDHEPAVSVFLTAWEAKNARRMKPHGEAEENGEKKSGSEALPPHSASPSSSSSAEEEMAEAEAPPPKPTHEGGEGEGVPFLLRDGGKEERETATSHEAKAAPQGRRSLRRRHQTSSSSARMWEVEKETQAAWRSLGYEMVLVPPTAAPLRGTRQHTAAAATALSPPARVSPLPTATTGGGGGARPAIPPRVPRGKGAPDGNFPHFYASSSSPPPPPAFLMRAHEDALGGILPKKRPSFFPPRSTTTTLPPSPMASGDPTTTMEAEEGLPDIPTPDPAQAPPPPPLSSSSSSSEKRKTAAPAPPPFTTHTHLSSSSSSFVSSSSSVSGATWDAFSALRWMKLAPLPPVYLVQERLAVADHPWKNLVEASRQYRSRRPVKGAAERGWSLHRDHHHKTEEKNSSKTSPTIKRRTSTPTRLDVPNANEEGGGAAFTHLPLSPSVFSSPVVALPEEIASPSPNAVTPETNGSGVESRGEVEKEETKSGGVLPPTTRTVEEKMEAQLELVSRIRKTSRKM